MNWKLHPIGRFAQYQEYWQLLNQDSVASPALDVAFVQPLLEQFGNGREVLACYGQSGRYQAMTILVDRGLGRWESFQPAQAPLGLWLCDLSAMQWHGLLSQLIRTLPGFTVLLGILQQDPMLLRRPEHGRALQTLDHIRTACIAMHGTFESYWKSRGINLRQNLKRQRNKLRRLGVGTRLQLSTDPRDVMQAIADFSALERAGWKEAAGTAVHADDAQGRFYQAVLAAFSRSHAARIYRYWFDDRLVAMDLYIEGHGTAVLLKTAHDETIRQFSPALLMREEIVAQMFQTPQLDTIELYGRYVGWNAQWSTDVRTMYHINHYRWNMLSYVHRGLHKAAIAARPTPVAAR